MKKYVVALQTGGLQEDPNLKYSDYQIIEAQNENEAKEFYNTRNKCSFFYGSVLGEVIDTDVFLCNWCKKIVINQPVNAKLYAKICLDYSSFENYQPSFYNLIVEYSHNTKTSTNLDNEYILIGNYDADKDELKIDIKYIEIVNCIANYKQKTNSIVNDEEPDKSVRKIKK